MNNRQTPTIVLLLIVLSLLFAALSGCTTATINPTNDSQGVAPTSSVTVTIDPVVTPERFSIESFLANPPQYTGEPVVIINNNIPLFTEEDFKTINTVIYSDLDDLGRCGSAIALIGPETVPSEPRGQIGDIKPSGWHTVRYDDRIEDRYLYNRCHLIGYQLAGENAEPRNLITGTRYLNISSMLPFENAIWGFVTGTGNHVLYRVTPVFEGDNLVASGVVLEACSVEDSGDGIQFFVYLFNIQPGVIIDYRTGDSYADSEYDVPTDESDALLLLIPDQDLESDVPDRSIEPEHDTDDAEITYVLNTNSMRFHDPSCPSIADIKQKNLSYSTDTRDVLIELGYTPCGRCNP